MMQVMYDMHKQEYGYLIERRDPRTYLDNLSNCVL